MPEETPAVAAGESTPPVEAAPQEAAGTLSTKAEPALPELDPSATVFLEELGKDASLGDMARSFIDKQKPADPAVPAAEDPKLENFKLFEQAMGTDASAHDAARKLMDIYRPAAPAEETPQTQEQQMQALQQQVQGLREALGQVTPITTHISQTMGVQHLKNTIDKVQEHIPHVHKHPQGSDMVVAKLNEYDQLARMQNVDLSASPLEFRNKVLGMALQHAENTIRSTIGVFGGAELKPAPKGEAIQATDDQGKTATQKVEESHIRANLSVDAEGNLIDRRNGKRVLGPQGTRGTVPDQPVAQVPTGHGVAADPATPTEGLFSEKSMLDQMKGRISGG